MDSAPGETKNSVNLHVHRWQVIRRYTTAAAILAFPLIFMLDVSIDWGMSPILPGIAIILILWIVTPFIVWEIMTRFWKPKDSNRIKRQTNMSRAAIGVAFLVFFIWLAVMA